MKFPTLLKVARMNVARQSMARHTSMNNSICMTEKAIAEIEAKGNVHFKVGEDVPAEAIRDMLQRKLQEAFGSRGVVRVREATPEEEAAVLTKKPHMH